MHAVMSCVCYRVQEDETRGMTLVRYCISWQWTVLCARVYIYNQYISISTCSSSLGGCLQITSGFAASTGLPLQLLINYCACVWQSECSGCTCMWSAIQKFEYCLTYWVHFALQPFAIFMPSAVYSV